MVVPIKNNIEDFNSIDSIHSIYKMYNSGYALYYSEAL